jgi:hypothetical protein
MEKDIERMIAAEDNPSQRAFLIVLNSINNALIENTAMTKEVSVKLESHLVNFSKHIKDEDEIMNKGRGAWKVIASVAGILQLLVFGYFSQMHSEVSLLQDFRQTQMQSNVSDELRISRLETLTTAAKPKE